MTEAAMNRRDCRHAFWQISGIMWQPGSGTVAVDTVCPGCGDHGECSIPLSDLWAMIARHHAPYWDGGEP